ncbi:MAG: hypothetical protein HQ568_06975, partial [Calditrichaeota bacterium]|nr:hypothetical protein [Calditrichota bacterium]
ITWSPKVRRIFDRARSEFKNEEITVRAKRSAVEAEICRSASMKSLYLPGSGQLYKGYKEKGITLGTVFWCVAATFVYSQVSLPTARDRYLNATNQADVVQRWEEYRDIYRLNKVSGALTATIYTYIFFDTLLRKPKPEKVEERY